MSQPKCDEQEIFFLCRDPIYRVRDLSNDIFRKNSKKKLINHGRDKSGPYRKRDVLMEGC
jgi:hypothetical protein